MMIALYITFALAMLAQVADASYTAYGIKRSLAFEASWYIRAAFGPSPSFSQLMAIDGTARVAIFLAGLLIHPRDLPYAITAGAIGGLIGATIRSVTGFRKWYNLIHKSAT